MAIDPGSGLNLAFRLLRLVPPNLHIDPPSLSPVSPVHLPPRFPQPCFGARLGASRPPAVLCRRM